MCEASCDYLMAHPLAWKAAVAEASLLPQHLGTLSLPHLAASPMDSAAPLLLPMCHNTARVAPLPLSGIRRRCRPLHAQPHSTPLRPSVHSRLHSQAPTCGHVSLIFVPCDLSTARHVRVGCVAAAKADSAASYAKWLLVLMWIVVIGVPLAVRPSSPAHLAEPICAAAMHS